MKRSAPMKRVEFKRTPKEPSFSRPEHPRAKEASAKPAKPAKDRTCICGATFTPKRMEHVVCSPKCLLAKKKADAKAERASLKARKEAIKTIPQLLKEAQLEFNAFIRERDRGQTCICCGRALGDGDIGGSYDCGHYRSVGSAPHLRFDERNAHAQTKQCNRWGAGRAVDYRIGLVARIGRPAVEALEAENGIRKWTREELTAIKAEYRAKRRALEKQSA